MATACLSDVMGWDVIHDCESSSKYILRYPSMAIGQPSQCVLLLPLLFSQSWTIWFIFVLADTVDGASLTDRIDSTVISGHVCPQQASLLTWDQGANKVIATALQRCFLSLSSFHGGNSWKGSDSCVSSREESPLFVMTTGTLIRQCTQEKQTVLVVLSWEGLLIVRGQDTTVSFYQSRLQKSKFTFCLFTSLFLVFRHE